MPWGAKPPDSTNNLVNQLDWNLVPLLLLELGPGSLRRSNTPATASPVCSATPGPLDKFKKVRPVPWLVQGFEVSRERQGSCGESLTRNQQQRDRRRDRHCQRPRSALTRPPQRPPTLLTAPTLIHTVSQPLALLDTKSSPVSLLGITISRLAVLGTLRLANVSASVNTRLGFLPRAKVSN